MDADAQMVDVAAEDNSAEQKATSYEVVFYLGNIVVKTIAPAITAAI